MVRSYFIFVSLVVLSGVAWAAPTVRLEVGDEALFANEPTMIAIEVEGYRRNVVPPDWPDLDGATVRKAGEESYMVNRYQRVKLNYELTVYQPGDFKIPALQVYVDGAARQTEPVVLHVQPSDAYKYLAVEVDVGQRPVYVGQRVVARMTLWVRPPVINGRMVPIDTMLRQVAPVSLGPFPPQVMSKGLRKRTVDGEEVDFYAYDFEAPLVLEQPGPLNVGDVVLSIAYPMGRRTRNLRAAATAGDIEVLPVPTEGRPMNYTGAVGLYDIETRAQPTSVRVGDPIELTIEIFGEGPLNTLPPPALDEQAGLAQAFRLPEHAPAGEVVSARRRFVLQIRALRADVQEVPSIEYPYFDPHARRFIVARSKPIPIAVEATSEVSAADVLPTPQANNTTQLQQLDGLRDIETHTSDLLAQAWLPTPRFIALVMFAPPAAFLVVWALVALQQQRSADPARQRRGRALRAARRLILAANGQSAADRAVTVQTALGQYLADRLDAPPARFVGRAALEVLQERAVAPDLLARCTQLIEQCEAASFGGGGAATALTDEALACLDGLERCRL